MRKERGSGTFTSSSEMMSLTVSFGFAPSSMRTPPRTSTGTSIFTLSCKFSIGVGKDQHFDRAGQVLQRSLRVKIALLRFQHAQIGDDSGRGKRFIFTGRRFHGAQFRGRKRAQVFQLVAIFIERMSGDEEAENLFFIGKTHVLVPVGSVGQAVFAAT